MSVGLKASTAYLMKGEETIYRKSRWESPMLRVFFLVSSLVSPGVIWSQRNLDIEYVENIEPLHYVAQRSLGSIVIDGKLDEPSWQRAQWTPAFVDIEGDRKERPAFLTRAKMLWDDKYFYIAADLEEPHVWATLTKRDAVISVSYTHLTLPTKA